MSAAERTAPVPVSVPVPRRRRPARPSTRFFRSELGLMFRRRRNQAGLLVLAAVPVLMATVVKIHGGSGRPGGGPDFVDSISTNGLFVGLAALTIEIPLFLPLAVATISGDSVAGEANLGTLRYLLTVPVNRTRLLLVKFAAITVFAVVCAFLVVLTGVILGLLLFGGGPLTTLSGTQLGFGAGVVRIALAAVYVSAGLAALGAVGLFISTLTEQPIGATIAIVIFSSASFIVDSIPQLDVVHPFLLTHRWLAFGDLLRTPISTSTIWVGLFVDLAYAIVFLLAAWARFADKDVTS